MTDNMTSYVYGMLLLVFFASCADKWSENQDSTSIVDDSKSVEVPLSLGVTEMQTTIQTRSDAEDTPAERMINDIWVFQYGQDGKLLITPRYYDIIDVDPGEVGAEVDVLLRTDVSNTIVYVVANTGSDNWATVENASTFDQLQNLTLPDPKIIVGKDALGVKVEGSEAQATGEPTNLDIPMEGYVSNVTFTDGTVKVPLTRMYAKVIVTVGAIPETIELTDVNAMDIPYYCRVGTLEGKSLNDAAAYPTERDYWNSRPFKPGDKNENDQYPGQIVIYMPENLQGCSDNHEANPELKTKKGNHSFGIELTAYYVNIFTGEHDEGSRRTYSWYPGGNNYNDYNIRRNYIYQVQLNIYTDTYEQDTPSANCFVVKPGQLLSFLPYYRVETGSGYKFTDYLDAYGTDDKKINASSTMSENVAIIWQTKDAIGDNSAGNLVWIDSAPTGDGLTDEEKGQQEFHRKIHVRAGKRGNALIAAYNNQGEILWSWHIWVTENDPSNVSSAILYTTYAWNEDGIKTNIRVPGYNVMPCNLGALRYIPDGDDVTGTYGMVYQWGRKDPFPPAYSGDAGADYTDARTGSHYGNDNQTEVGKTIGTDKSKLFHSLPGTEITQETLPDPIGFTVRNPTVFMCGTRNVQMGELAVENLSNYQNNGDWTWNHDEGLWGGLKPDPDNMKYYTTTNNVHIYDNYGEQKTIFDPCPSGWRVPPGDIWLGFTSTGENPKVYEEINTDGVRNNFGEKGMYMYMTDWKQGPVSFFPTQGTRVADGGVMRVGRCGNYHNATTDDNFRVNILHIHNSVGLFHIFETSFPMYYVKSMAGPIRCVRDHK